jgi:hypothetical protein
MAILPRAGAARRAGRRDGLPPRPGQHLLVGPIPSAPAVRIRPHRPAHDPLASHLSLPVGGIQLRPRSPVWTAPAAPAETSSGASATGGPGKTCHLRLGHLHDVVEELALAQPRGVPQLAVALQLRDGLRVGRVLVAVTVRGSAVCGCPSALRKNRFCNGPSEVNPLLSLVLSPASRFCPGSARGRHLMGSDEERAGQS